MVEPHSSSFRINTAIFQVSEYLKEFYGTLQKLQKYFYSGQIKNMCGSGYPTYPKILPPTLNFFSPNFEV